MISVFPPMAANSSKLSNSESSILARISSIGVVLFTWLSMSQSPVAKPIFSADVLKASVRIENTIKVKITRANMDNVSPVRNLALKG